MATILNETEILFPDPSDVEAARAVSRSLAGRGGSGEVDPLELRDQATGEVLKLPPTAYRALLRILYEFGQGHAVTVMPVDAELSTQQAADLLNVSRPYVVKLVDDGALPSRKVGVQRRLLLGDVLAYKKAMYERQLKGMAELTAISEDLGLYDEPSK